MMKAILWVLLGLIVLAFAKLVLAIMPGGGGVRARLDLGPSGGQYMLTQESVGPIGNPYWTHFWHLPPGETRWKQYEFQTNTLRWFNVEIDYDPKSKTVYLIRAGTTELEYSPESNILLVHHPMPAGKAFKTLMTGNYYYTGPS